MIELKGFAYFPSSVEYGHIDMGVVDVFTGFPCVPRQHITRRPDRPLRVENGKERSVFEMNCLLEMFRHAAHVKRDYDSSA